MLQESKKLFGLSIFRIALNLMLLLLYGNLLPGTMGQLLYTNTSLSNATRIVSRNPNITILHEVHEEGFSTKKDKPTMQANILSLKSIKKKLYMPLEKPTTPIYDKSKPTKPPLDLHPVIFDYSLGDLEDLEHETFKKKDLSAEEKLLLRDASAEAPDVDDDSVLVYTDELKTPNSETLQDNLSIQVDFVTTSSEKTLQAESSTTASSFATSSTSLATAAATTASTFSSETAVSPHIYKILKNKSLKKGRELYKYDDMPKGLNNHNSLQHYLTIADEATASGSSMGSNVTAAAALQTANIFRIVTNIYDHFYWQASDIRTKVSTGCGLEMQAYLTALHSNYNWAQKAYDASGRYRGQLFFGNDKWLGLKMACYELNRQLDPAIRKHFEFQFYAAYILFKLKMPERRDFNLQLGECLPKSCTAMDVEHILEMDPHSEMLLSFNATHQQLAQLKILRVRTVPGLYSIWREMRFQILMSLMITLILLVIVATWYQFKLNQRKLKETPISVISSKIDVSPIQHISRADNGKSFELYQMTNMNKTENINNNNNNNDDGMMESNINERKTNDGNNFGYSNGYNGIKNGQRSINGGGGGNANIHNETDYRIETNNCHETTYETIKQLGLHEQILLCFSFQTNASSILKVDKLNEPQTSCVHGLRVISVLWTMLVHTYLQMFYIGENQFRRVIVERATLYQLVGNATYSVDTFFFISGFLVTLLYLKHDKKHSDNTRTFLRKGFLETTQVVVYRYIRLTPAYLFVIFFYDFMMKEAFNNSVYQPNVDANTCSQYWWRNILYINNFYPFRQICMIWSWYMANDMQFFLMGTVMLILSKRYFKSVVLILFTFLVSSWGISGMISLHYHYTHKVSKPFESFDFLYDKPWQRVGPYLIGMMVGYIINKYRTPPKISCKLNCLLWFCSLGMLALIIFGVWQGELGEVATAYYVSIGHTAYSVGLVWIVLSCCWGLTPTINHILSYRPLFPLSRLTYCAYLVHPALMSIIANRMEGTIHLTNISIFIFFMGNAVSSFIVAFFISVMFEAPVIRLLRIIFRK